MSTYWLTCKDGPVRAREEISWRADIQPVFLDHLKLHPPTDYKLPKRK